jgi:hypothetical protein
MRLALLLLPVLLAGCAPKLYRVCSVGAATKDVLCGPAVAQAQADKESARYNAQGREYSSSFVQRCRKNCGEKLTYTLSPDSLGDRHIKHRQMARPTPAETACETFKLLPSGQIWIDMSRCRFPNPPTSAAGSPTPSR